MVFNNVYQLLESRFYNDSLSPNFWENSQFDSSVRKKLLSIVEDFIGDQNIGVIDDIQLTGSLANYNYTVHSDLDVHILSDFSKINPDTELVKAALDGKRFIWNLRHSITIRGYEVELYFQDTHEPHIASGLFSLLHNEWIRVPKYNPPEIDPKDVDKKADSIIDVIDRFEVETNKELSPDNATKWHNLANILKGKIGKMRRSGLKREGEFSVENLAFKKLRNTGAIGKLADIITNAYSKIYSEQTEPVVRETTGYFDNILDRINKPNTRRGPSDMIQKLLGTKKGPRQQKWGTGVGRLHQNFVPDMHKVDSSLNHKIETLRKTPGIMTATPTDIKYNIKDLSKDIRLDDPKFLGTTNIMVYYDSNKGTYVFHKA